jgi:hypothetical protein
VVGAAVISAIALAIKAAELLGAAGATLLGETWGTMPSLAKVPVLAALAVERVAVFKIVG